MRINALAVTLALLVAGITAWPPAASATTTSTHTEAATPLDAASPGAGATSPAVFSWGIANPSTGPALVRVATGDGVPAARTADVLPPVTFTPVLTARLTATLAHLRDQYRLPGLQVAVRFPNGTAWLGHAGFGVLASSQASSTLGGSTGPQALSNLTLFEAGSITKTFVAALTLQLASQGVLSLGDPIARWLPGLPYDTGITVQELLDHTSGVDDPFNHDPLLDALAADHRTAWTPDQVLAYVTKTLFPPGTKYAYSNTDYILLGQVIERATGHTLASLLRQRFFGPLQLTHTYLQGEEAAQGTAAHGYDTANSTTAGPSSTTAELKDLSDGTAYVPYTSIATAIGAAGAIVSTADDLARWALYLYRGKVLPQAWLDQMLDFGLTSAYDPPLPYGLGVERRSLSGYGSWGHGGALDGFRAAVRYFPSAGGVSIVAMANADRVNPDVLVRALLDDLYPSAS